MVDAYKLINLQTHKLTNSQTYKPMKYYSTNKQASDASLEEAVVKGLASDKGLYMPYEIKPLPKSFFDEIENLSFQEIAYRVADAFFGEDVPAETLKHIVYDTLNFDVPAVKVKDNIYSLELFHGPTLAFKDVGGRFMARLLGYFIRKEGKKEVNVLVATSGDTGSAVANGFLGCVSKDQAHNDLVVDFLMYYSSQEGMSTYLDAGLENGLVPNGMSLVYGVEYPDDIQNAFSSLTFIGNCQKGNGCRLARGLSGVNGDIQESYRQFYDYSYRYLNGEINVDEFLAEHKANIMQYLPEALSSSGISEKDLENPQNAPTGE